MRKIPRQVHLIALALTALADTAPAVQPSASAKAGQQRAHLKGYTFKCSVPYIKSVPVDDKCCRKFTPRPEFDAVMYTGITLAV